MYGVQVRQRIHEDGEAPAVPITVRQLEAVVRISEALARMQLCCSATQAHVQLALDLFKVSTLNAANAGVADNLVCFSMLLAAPAVVGMICWSCDMYESRALSGSCVVLRHNIGLILLVCHMLIDVVTRLTGLASPLGKPS